MTIHEQLIEYRDGYDAPMAPPRHSLIQFLDEALR